MTSLRSSTKWRYLRWLRTVAARMHAAGYRRMRFVRRYRRRLKGYYRLTRAKSDNVAYSSACREDNKQINRSSLVTLESISLCVWQLVPILAYRQRAVLHNHGGFYRVDNIWISGFRGFFARHASQKNKGKRVRYSEFTILLEMVRIEFYC